MVHILWCQASNTGRIYHQRRHPSIVVPSCNQPILALVLHCSIMDYVPLGILAHTAPGRLRTPLHLPKLLGIHPADRQQLLALFQPQRHAAAIVAHGSRDFCEPDHGAAMDLPELIGG